MTVASEFEVANQQYAASFDKADLPMPPGRYASHIYLSAIHYNCNNWHSY